MAPIARYLAKSARFKAKGTFVVELVRQSGQGLDQILLVEESVATYPLGEEFDLSLSPAAPDLKPVAVPVLSPEEIPPVLTPTTAGKVEAPGIPQTQLQVIAPQPQWGYSPDKLAMMHPELQAPPLPVIPGYPQGKLDAMVAQPQPMQQPLLPPMLVPQLPQGYAIPQVQPQPQVILMQPPLQGPSIAEEVALAFKKLKETEEGVTDKPRRGSEKLSEEDSKVLAQLIKKEKEAAIPSETDGPFV